MSPRCSFELGSGMVFHLIISDGVCYLGLFDYIYPKMLAFKFLEEVRDIFREELKREFGSGSVDHRSHIETIERPYHFIRFDRQILKKQLEFDDPASSRALGKLQSGAVQSSHVMGHINDILQPAVPCKGMNAGTVAELELSSSKLVGTVGTVTVVCLTTFIAAALTVSGFTQVWTHGAIALSGTFGASMLLFSRGRTSQPKRSSDDSFVSDCIL